MSIDAALERIEKRLEACRENMALAREAGKEDEACDQQARIAELCRQRARLEGGC
jgi:hypothetical protein